MTRLKSASRRKDRPAGILREQDVDANPFRQFTAWFDAAVKRKIPTVEAMALATASLSAAPAVRMVLLKGTDARGFIFYTNFGSRKGKHLVENPQAALLFHWPQMERQIRIEGTIEKVSRGESARYFKSRPRKSQLGAWASRQSEILIDRSQLEAQFKQVENQYRGQDVPLPEFWGGFRLLPRQFEFWQGRPNRLHDRIAYLREGKTWKIVRLSP
ncbi:MAG TPA: pyridoxamine 5'-phosphate oxidase [Bacteroidota bacterium]|nr:pyridoxamine 5'-phosphate oxidase [Bacteroidota bacterium]